MGGHTTLSFPAHRCGSAGKRAGAMGARGNSCPAQSDHLSGQASASQKTCLVPSLAAVLGRGGESTKATPALETAPLPALLPAPRCTPAGKMASALQEQNNPAFELAVRALKNDLPRTKDCPRLTSPSSAIVHGRARPQLGAEPHCAERRARR